MQLDHLIGKLLLHNNCVVVPSFGGFVASRVSAQLDYQKGSMRPPQKAVLFNKQLINNDGLLIHAFAQENGIGFDEAALQIDAQVSIWQQDLRDGKRIEFEQVGYLFLDNEKNLRFEQDRFHNLLLASFGMGGVQFVSEQVIEAQTEPLEIAPIQEKIRETPIISLKPVEKQIPFVAKQTGTEKKPAPIRRAYRQAGNISTKRVVKYVAAACLIPLGFYSFWLPMKTDVLESGLISTQDFNPFHKKEKATYEGGQKLDLQLENNSEATLEEQLARLPESVTTYSFDLFENGTYVHLKIKDKQADSVSENPSTNTSNENPVSNGNIQVLAGSFSNVSNAQSLKKQLLSLGFSAFTYLESNGLTRVSAGKFESLNEAQTAVEKLAEAGKSAWILK